MAPGAPKVRGGADKVSLPSCEEQQKKGSQIQDLAKVPKNLDTFVTMASLRGMGVCSYDAGSNDGAQKYGMFRAAPVFPSASGAAPGVLAPGAHPTNTAGGGAPIVAPGPKGVIAGASKKDDTLETWAMRVGVALGIATVVGIGIAVIKKIRGRKAKSPGKPGGDATTSAHDSAKKALVDQLLAEKTPAPKPASEPPAKPAAAVPTPVPPKPAAPKPKGKPAVANPTMMAPAATATPAPATTVDPDAAPDSESERPTRYFAQKPVDSDAVVTQPRPRVVGEPNPASRDPLLDDAAKTLVSDATVTRVFETETAAIESSPATQHMPIAMGDAKIMGEAIAIFDQMMRLHGRLGPANGEEAVAEVAVRLAIRIEAARRTGQPFDPSDVAYRFLAQKGRTDTTTIRIRPLSARVSDEYARHLLRVHAETFRRMSGMDGFKKMPYGRLLEKSMTAVVRYKSFEFVEIDADGKMVVTDKKSGAPTEQWIRKNVTPLPGITPPPPKAATPPPPPPKPKAGPPPLPNQKPKAGPPPLPQSAIPAHPDAAKINPIVMGALGTVPPPDNGAPTVANIPQPLSPTQLGVASSTLFDSGPLTIDEGAPSTVAQPDMSALETRADHTWISTEESAAPSEPGAAMPSQPEPKVKVVVSPTLVDSTTEGPLFGQEPPAPTVVEPPAPTVKEQPKVAKKESGFWDFLMFWRPRGGKELVRHSQAREAAVDEGMPRQNKELMAELIRQGFSFDDAEAISKSDKVAKVRAWYESGMGYDSSEFNSAEHFIAVQFAQARLRPSAGNTVLGDPSALAHNAAATMASMPATDTTGARTVLGAPAATPVPKAVSAEGVPHVAKLPPAGKR